MSPATPPAVSSSSKVTPAAECATAPGGDDDRASGLDAPSSSSASGADFDAAIRQGNYFSPLNSPGPTASSADVPPVAPVVPVQLNLSGAGHGEEGEDGGGESERGCDVVGGADGLNNDSGGSNVADGDASGVEVDGSPTRPVGDSPSVSVLALHRSPRDATIERQLVEEVVAAHSKFIITSREGGDEPKPFTSPLARGTAGNIPRRTRHRTGSENTVSSIIQMSSMPGWLLSATAGTILGAVVTLGIVKLSCRCK